MPHLTYAEQCKANVSDACHRDGNFCDGMNTDGIGRDSDECACGCHNVWGPNFTTYAQVRDYHLPPDIYRPASDADGPQVRRIPTFDGTDYVLREQYR